MKMKNKKILLICNHFAPDNTIAAVRTTKLAKYFKKAGYEILVIAERKKNNLIDTILENDAKDIKVIRAENSNAVIKITDIYKKIIAPAKKKRFNNLDDRIKINPKTGNKEFYTFETMYPVIGSLDYLFELLRQYDLFFNIKGRLKQYKDVDYLLTSYGDFFSYYAGKYFHKKNKNVPWIFDIRDAICKYKFTPKYVKFYAMIAEKKIWKKADFITCVSNDLCNRVSKKYRNKAHRIPSGYDMDDRNNIELQKKNNNFIFAYTGSMYGGLQDLSPFFKCISELCKENKINKSYIEFHYAGNETAYNIFIGQAAKYGLGKNCVYVGKLERKDSLKLQSNADVLLVSTFDYKENKVGVITGKVHEYMSANKPIIAIINGDNPCNELAKITKEINMGFAYEEYNKADDFLKMKEYLFKIIKEYENTGKINYKPDKKILNEYDYANISKKFIEIFEKYD